MQSSGLEARVAGESDWALSTAEPEIMVGALVMGTSALSLDVVVVGVSNTSVFATLSEIPFASWEMRYSSLMLP